jgi:plastocyanin
VHPGGLWTDLSVVRPGAKVKRKVRRCRKVGTRRRCRRVTRVVGRDSVRAFRSNARYFDKRGPVSWDMAMDATRPDWRVGVKKGDTLRVSATYDTERASWYESMGIMVGFAADGDKGPDPFATKVDTPGEPTHGHLKENENYGGAETGAPDPTKLPDGSTLNDEVGIFGFTYTPGNIGAPGVFGQPPVIEQGKSLTFENPDATAQVFHTITACKAPCNRSTGIAYPLADGDVDFDSGELGYGPTGFSAAANRHNWATPTDLKPGTYTYFCRVHPYMRGAFRVKGKS